MKTDFSQFRAGTQLEPFGYQHTNFMLQAYAERMQLAETGHSVGGLCD